VDALGIWDDLTRRKSAAAVCKLQQDRLGWWQNQKYPGVLVELIVEAPGMT
jgi:hypothetical protein